jgi:hypothetical protein
LCPVLTAWGSRAAASAGGSAVAAIQISVTGHRGDERRYSRGDGGAGRGVIDARDSQTGASGEQLVGGSGQPVEVLSVDVAVGHLLGPQIEQGGGSASRRVRCGPAPMISVRYSESSRQRVGPARASMSNGIVPGYVATDNTEALRGDPVRSRAILDRIPAGRWGSPEDFAGVAVFLASTASAYVHGTLIAVDGGWLAR